MYLNLESITKTLNSAIYRFLFFVVLIMTYVIIMSAFNVWIMKFFFMFLNPAAFFFFDLYYVSIDTYWHYYVLDFMDYTRAVKKNQTSHFIVEIAAAYSLFDLQPFISQGDNFATPLFVYSLIFFFSTSLCSFFLFQHLGLYGTFLLNFVSIILVFFSLILEFNQILFEGVSYRLKVGNWCNLTADYRVDFSFYVDAVSYSFMFLTVTIAMFVNSYAFAYFRYEPLVERLLVFLNAFVLSMVMLVTSNNLAVLFLGWELIGITSFFLINFWAARTGTLKAAFKAFSFNKYSDVMLFIAILLIFSITHDLDITVFLNQLHLFTTYYINVFLFEFLIIDVISVAFLGAAFVKSAQLGAHIWLPDSMEAPVPASALIHSATLVSAGIFLVMRFSKMFELSTTAYIIIPVIGSVTAFIGGFISMFQTDVKRVLAYSTISHCGFLMLISAFFCPEYTVLYLYVHGFFKAAVFLCVGSVIRFSKNYQDFRRMGGLYKYLPFECFAAFVCLLNLGGLPFTYGFFIKHYLFVVFNCSHWLHGFIWLNAVLASFTGIFYSYRLFYYVFFDFKKGRKAIYFSNNRTFFKSIYYTNSSMASVLSITGLIAAAYLIIFVLFYKITCTQMMFSEFNKIVDFNTKTLTSSNNAAFLFNFFTTAVNIFFFYIFVFFVSWRFIFNSTPGFFSLFLVTVFLILCTLYWTIF